jgi:hypothetical protein
MFDVSLSRLGNMPRSNDTSLYGFCGCQERFPLLAFSYKMCDVCYEGREPFIFEMYQQEDSLVVVSRVQQPGDTGVVFIVARQTPTDALICH